MSIARICKREIVTIDAAASACSGIGRKGAESPLIAQPHSCLVFLPHGRPGMQQPIAAP